MNIGAKAMESYQCPQPTNCNRLSPLTPPRDASSPPWERQPRRSGTSQSLESSVFVLSSSWNAPAVFDTMDPSDVAMWPPWFHPTRSRDVSSAESIPNPWFLGDRFSIFRSRHGRDRCRISMRWIKECLSLIMNHVFVYVFVYVFVLFFCFHSSICHINLCVIWM